ncbi:potassium channel family protein [Pyrolobus fumarii]|nr:NAD-binding protein [Pyrolobus fumarii]
MALLPVFAGVLIALYKKIVGITRKLLTHTEIVIVLFAFSVWIAAGIAFSIVEGINLPDALYWALVTIATVGYGDITPQTPLGKIVACITIVAGIAAFTSLVSVTAERLMEAAQRRREGLIVYKGEGHVVIIGWNPATESAYNELRSLNVAKHIVLVHERGPVIHDEMTTTVRGDPTRTETLLRASVDKASMAIVALDDDAKTALTVLAVKALNPRARIVAEALYPEHVDLIHKAGADIVLATRSLGGRLLAAALLEPGAAMFVEDAASAAYGKAKFKEIPGKRFAGKPFGEAMRLLREKGCTPIAVRRGTALIPNPPDSLIILESDAIVVVTPREEETC